MMKKSLLALSVAAAAMGAQAADVQVYGLIDTSLSFVSSDADIAGHDRVNSFSMENAKEFGSRFGLKGSEDLGNGYKVAFVLESGIKSDDGSLDQGGKLFGREAHARLRQHARRRRSLPRHRPALCELHEGLRLRPRDRLLLDAR